jgi:hypothetical protein
MRVRTQQWPCLKHAQCIKRMINFPCHGMGALIGMERKHVSFGFGPIRESSLRVDVWLESTGHPIRARSQYSAVSAGIAKKRYPKSNYAMRGEPTPHIAFRWMPKTPGYLCNPDRIWNLPRGHARKPYTPERGVHPVQESKQRYHT